MITVGFAELFIYAMPLLAYRPECLRVANDPAIQ
jgi:hypothetical protein